MKWILIVCQALSLSAFTQTVKTENVQLGSTTIMLKTHTYNPAKAKAVFLNLHENESTSVQATRQYMAANGGTMVTVNHTGERNVNFRYKGKSYNFDPNRIFSKKGRVATLKSLSKSYTNAAEDVAENFAEAIEDKIEDAKIIIAIHNNTEGNLSVKSYVNSKATTYVNPKQDPDDFVLTTDRRIFDHLRSKKINAVLQSHKVTSDDGSLSIYCSKKNIPYINIEAQHGHTAEQVRMLNALTSIINEYLK